MSPSRKEISGLNCRCLFQHPRGKMQAEDLRPRMAQMASYLPRTAANINTSPRPATFAAKPLSYSRSRGLSQVRERACCILVREPMVALANRFVWLSSIRSSILAWRRPGRYIPGTVT